MFSSAEDPAMVYALAGLASLVAALLAWRAYRQAAEAHRRRKDETKRRRDQ
jgi:hypothetical protein